MLQAIRNLKQRGKIPDLNEQEKIDALARVANSRARIEMQGFPLRYKPTAVARYENQPTPEREAKTNGVDVIQGRWGTRDQPAFRIRHPLDAHGDKFPIEIELALTKFMADSSHHQSVRVARLDSSFSGGNADRRLGGLGECPQEVRDCHARHQWIFDRLNADLQETALVLLMRERQRTDGAFFSMEDFGGELVPRVKDDRVRKGVSLGALRILGCELSRLYRAPQCPQIRRSEKTMSEEAITVFAAYKRLVAHG